MRPLIAAIAVFGFSFGSAETITFDSTRIGAMPPGWSVFSNNSAKPGRWQVATDGTAPSRPHVLAQLGIPKGADCYALALFNHSIFKDGDLSVDVKIVSGKLQQSAGVVWRFQDPSNYYFAVASADYKSVSIFKKVNGRVSLLAHASVTHPVDDREWNVIRVKFRGPRILLFFGHRKLIDTMDNTIDAPGKTGLWTRADTVAYFDNFRIDRRD
ncbi:family 16 glycoside hydrolase [Nevskia soli]|uniref:family 16 glycoside hydrolase n=1 Tax=Nevskia soli TaxID=418856 RepID=UPI0015D7C89B|nr:family 16 glycoside hydrolase [Nevskia soli]